MLLSREESVDLCLKVDVVCVSASALFLLFFFQLSYML